MAVPLGHARPGPLLPCLLHAPCQAVRELCPAAGDPTFPSQAQVFTWLLDSTAQWPPGHLGLRAAAAQTPTGSPIPIPPLSLVRGELDQVEVSKPPLPASPDRDWTQRLPPAASGPPQSCAPARRSQWPLSRGCGPWSLAGPRHPTLCFLKHLKALVTAGPSRILKAFEMLPAPRTMKSICAPSHDAGVSKLCKGPESR